MVRPDYYSFDTWVKKFEAVKQLFEETYVPITAAALEGQEEFRQMANNYHTPAKKRAGVKDKSIFFTMLSPSSPAIEVCVHQKSLCLENSKCQLKNLLRATQYTQST
jgi:hypothetical protein